MDEQQLCAKQGYAVGHCDVPMVKLKISNYISECNIVKMIVVIMTDKFWLIIRNDSAFHCHTQSRQVKKFSIIDL